MKITDAVKLVKKRKHGTIDGDILDITWAVVCFRAKNTHFYVDLQCLCLFSQFKAHKCHSTLSDFPENACNRYLNIMIIANCSFVDSQ